MPPFRPDPGFRRGAGGGSRVSRLRGTTTTQASSKREHIQRKLDRARTREENGTWRYDTPVPGAQEAKLARGTLYESTSRAELLRRVDTKARRYMNDLPADFMWGMIDGSDEVRATLILWIAL